MAANPNPIQKADASSASTAALIVTLSQLPVAGNTLIFAGGAAGSSVGPSGGGVTNWKTIKSFGVTSAADLWYGLVDGTPSTTITYTLSAAARCVAKVEEWPGKWLLDLAISASATNTTINAGTLTPSRDGCLLVDISVVFAAISAGPTGGFTDQTTVSSATFNMGVATLAQDARAAATCTYTCTSSGWDAALASMYLEPVAPVMTRMMLDHLESLRPGLRPPYAQQSGPADILATVVDAITYSDVATRAGTFLRTVTDSTTWSDVATRVATFLRSATDAIARSDVATQAGVYLRTITDTITRADVPTRLGVFLRDVTETITRSDVAARIGTFLRDVTDAIARSDAATQTKTILRSATDAITYADVATRLGVFLRPITETITRADVATRLGSFARTVTDSATYADVATRVLSAARSLADSITRADAVTRLGVFARTAAESITYSDVATQVKTILRTVTDAITRLDAAVQSVLTTVTPVQVASNTVASGSSCTVTIALPLLGNTLIVAVGDDTGTAAIASGQGGVTTWVDVTNLAGAYETHQFAGIVDGTPTTSVTATFTPGTRAMVEVTEWPGKWVLDQSTYNSGNSVTASSGTVTPLFSNELVIGSVVAFQTPSAGPTGGFTDLGTVASASFRMGMAYLVQSSPVAATTTYTIASDPWVGSIASFVRGASLARTVADAIARSDAATALKTVVRSVTDAINLTDAPLRLGTFGRTIAESITRVDTALRFPTFFRTALDSIARADVATQTKTFLRSAVESITRSDVATRTGSYFRFAIGIVTRTDVATKAGHAIERVVSETIRRFDRVFGSPLPPPPGSPQDKVEFIEDQGAPPDGDP